MFKKWFSRNKNLLLLLFLFAVSIAMRLPNLNKSLARHHEWLSAHVLVTETAWNKASISEYYFSPVYKYGEDITLQADFFSVVKDKNANTYYVSYPPFCFIAPYLFFKLFCLTPSFFGLQIFSLLIQLFTALILVSLIYKVKQKNMREDIYVPALGAFAVYVFSTANLWFCCNVYFADMLGQLFLQVQFI